MTENASHPPTVTEKKGIPILGWIGIGCGTLLIISIMLISMLIGFCTKKVSEFSKNPEKAAAEMMVKFNPDLKMVSQDDAKGEMTIRTKDGETLTLSYKDIAEGKFLIKDAEGNVAEIGNADLSKLPAWVPKVDDLENIVTSSQSESSGKSSGLYTGTSRKTSDELTTFFKDAAKDIHSNRSSNSSTSANGSETRLLNFEGTGKKLNIVITSKSGQNTQVNVTYEEAK